MPPRPRLLQNAFLSLVVGFLLAGCAEVQVFSHLFKKAGEGECQTVGANKIGNPYIVDGLRYEPMNSSVGYSEKGIASWYGNDFHGKATANGECYNMYAFTAAHKTLPLPTIVRVTNLENNRSIVVKVNDRGPFVRGRVLDLSYAAAQSLDIARTGTAPVLVEAIGGPFHKTDNGWFTAAAEPKRNAHDIPAETLPTVVPQTAQEEDLAPQVLPTQAQAKAEVARERKLGVPAPKTTLPKPPAYENRMFTDTTPLTHTRVYVQVGAYAEEARAAEQKVQLAKLYKTAHTSPVESGGKQLLRVRAGPFRSVADAEAALEKVVQAGFNTAQIKVEE